MPHKYHHENFSKDGPAYWKDVNEPIYEQTISDEQMDSLYAGLSYGTRVVARARVVAEKRDPRPAKKR